MDEEKEKVNAHPQKPITQIKFWNMCKNAFFLLFVKHCDVTITINKNVKIYTLDSIHSVKTRKPHMKYHTFPSSNLAYFRKHLLK